MARATNRLSARTVASLLKKPGRHSDGGGLYLAVSADGSRRRWVFLFRWKEPGEKGAGKLKEMGLGSAGTVSLARARERTAQARAQVADKQNPLKGRKAEARTPTFGEVADAVLASLEVAWRSPKHRQQWRMTLSKYCRQIRDIPVDAVSTDEVLAVLKPLWTKVPETTSRLRGRIEKVLDAAKAKGHRSGENPARWRGHLDSLVPKRQRLTGGHHKALAYLEIPVLMERLRASGSLSALCLEFTLLTAARSGEALGAQWSELDLSGGVWRVPASRMKAGREHRVAVSARACEIVRTLESRRRGDYVFPGQKANRPLSSMALGKVLRRLKVDATVHGFRSAFRDWAADQSEAPGEVAEAALAHTHENKVEAAYRRTDLFARRRVLMEHWAQQCEPRAEKPVSPSSEPTTPTVIAEHQGNQ
jgi:integrase